MAPLPAYPFHGLVAAYAIAPHHTLEARLQRCRDAHLQVETDALVEPAVEEYRALKPGEPAPQKVASHGWVYEVVYRELVVVGPEQVLREHALLQHIINIYVVADNLGQLPAQVLVGGPKSLRRAVAVVDLDAVIAQLLAHEALAAAYAARDSYVFHAFGLLLLDEIIHLRRLESCLAHEARVANEVQLALVGRVVGYLHVVYMHLEVGRPHEPVSH